MDFILNNILLIAVALVSGAMLLWPLLKQGTGGPWVEPAQATQLINREDAVIVDVRDPAEFAAGHVIGARSVPLAKIEAGAEELAKLKNRSLVLYCEGGQRAARAAAALRRLGFEKAATLKGGMPAWQQAGLPLEKS